jgi:hypothetical protein
MSEPSEVVVTAHSGGGGGGGSGSAGVTFSTYQNTSAAPPEGLAPNSSSAANTDTDVRVSIDLQDQSHMNTALASAQNVAAALIRLINAAKNNPSAQFILDDGHSMSGFALLAVLGNTKWVITDKPANMNPVGAGGSNFATGTDYLSYDSFAPGLGWGAFGESGMNGIILHEAGHLTSFGNANQLQENYWARQDVIQNNAGDYNDLNNPFFRDNEAFADDFSASAAYAMGVDVSNYLAASPFDGTYVGWASIASDHGM